MTAEPRCCVLALPAAFPGHRVTLGTGETTLCFDVTPAPGLNWQEVTAVKITKLIDAAGRPGGAGAVQTDRGGAVDEFAAAVIAFGGPGIRFGGPIGGGRFDPRTGAPIYPDTIPNPRIVAVPLKLGTPTARSIKRMEGLVLGEAITLANQQRFITVADPAKNTGVAFDGAGQLRLTVVSVTEAKGGGTSVQLLMEYPSPWSVAARRGGNPAGGIWPECRGRRNAMPTDYGPSTQPTRSHRRPSPSNYTDSSDDGLMMQQHLTLNFRKDVGVPAKSSSSSARGRWSSRKFPFVMENVPLP